MSLHIQQAEIEGIALLTLDGKLVLGPESTIFRDTLDALTVAGNTRVILNLRAVNFIDSTGLGTLMAEHTNLKKAGGGLRLLYLSQRHIELLVFTKLAAVFQVFDEEQAAIDSFFPDRKLRTFDILEFVKTQKRDQTSKIEPAG